jgi:hypothetical protein
VDVIEARLRAEIPILKRIYIEVGAPEDPMTRLTGGMPAERE